MKTKNSDKCLHKNLAGMSSKLDFGALGTLLFEPRVPGCQKSTQTSQCSVQPAAAGGEPGKGRSKAALTGDHSSLRTKLSCTPGKKKEVKEEQQQQSGSPCSRHRRRPMRQERDGAQKNHVLFVNSNFGQSSSALCQVKSCKRNFMHNHDLCTTTSDSLSIRSRQQRPISSSSGENLRKMVSSQIAMQNVLHKSMVQINKYYDELLLSNSELKLSSLERISRGAQTIAAVRRELSRRRASAKSVSSPGPSKCQTDNGAEDMVNSKVIEPMIRRIQRMYLHNLVDQMAIIRDLERVPSRVREVYKSAGKKE
ncbi:uncharacterized protein LOC108607279 [Drosophila busckii]|uniref:uncharacterized protein LOC108607279 n=1 Tax=Drosophila busckii TaxID=30019 RepID=UPI00083F1714|nr:uncharacterized protein LOC108607279 [Drosophila busckii]